MTYDIITIQGASSLMALTSPSCHCTHYAHACPSFCRTRSSSVAPSGESPGPALLSEHKWGVSRRPPSRPPSLGLNRRFWVPHSSSLPAPQCTPPALGCQSPVTSPALGMRAEPCSLRALCASLQIQPGPREEVHRQHTVGGSRDRPAEAGGEGAARRPG